MKVYRKIYRIIYRVIAMTEKLINYVNVKNMLKIMLKDFYNVFIKVIIFLVNLDAQESYPNLNKNIYMPSQNTFVHGESNTAVSTQLRDYHYRSPGNNE